MREKPSERYHLKLARPKPPAPGHVALVSGHREAVYLLDSLVESIAISEALQYTVGE